jgi:hypothetical protein
MLTMGCGIHGTSLPNRQNIIEDIDPFEYGDEFEGKTSDSEGLKSSVSNKAESIAFSGETEEKKNTVTNVNTDKESLFISSISDTTTNRFEYRVQIGIFEDRKSADKCREEALSKGVTNVYIEFEAPFYRVRAGGFKERKDVEKYVRVMQDYGFKGAFWVIKEYR